MNHETDYTEWTTAIKDETNYTEWTTAIIVETNYMEWTTAKWTEMNSIHNWNKIFWMKSHDKCNKV